MDTNFTQQICCYLSCILLLQLQLFLWVLVGGSFQIIHFLFLLFNSGQEKKEEEGKKFELIEPSALKSLKTEVGFFFLICNTPFVKVLSLNANYVSIYSPFTPPSENIVPSFLKCYYFNWWTFPFFFLFLPRNFKFLSICNADTISKI